MADNQKQQYVESLGPDEHKEPELAAAFVDSETGINDEFVRERRLKNDDAEQNIKLKKVVLNRLFLFLSVETFLIFLLSFFQATQFPFGFALEEWSFNLLITATILQITGMLFVAVRYLFPTKKDE